MNLTNEQIADQAVTKHWSARDTLPASPQYYVNELVHYTDRQQRPQTGRVRWIEARWHGWGHGVVEPLIIYALEHPTYTNQVFYTTAKNIRKAASRRENDGFRYD